MGRDTLVGCTKRRRVDVDAIIEMALVEYRYIDGREKRSELRLPNFASVVYAGLPKAGDNDEHDERGPAVDVDQKPAVMSIVIQDPRGIDVALPELIRPMKAISSVMGYRGKRSGRDARQGR